MGTNFEDFTINDLFKKEPELIRLCKLMAHQIVDMGKQGYDVDELENEFKNFINVARQTFTLNSMPSNKSSKPEHINDFNINDLLNNDYQLINLCKLIRDQIVYMREQGQDVKELENAFIAFINVVKKTLDSRPQPLENPNPPDESR